MERDNADIDRELRQGATLAERIDHLFVRVRPCKDYEYTLHDVVTGMRERYGISITSAYLSQLRRGRRANPGQAVLVALAGWFGVDPSYFFDMHSAEHDADALVLREQVRLLSDPQVHLLATRAAALSPESRHTLLMVAEEMGRLQEVRREETGKRRRWSRRKEAQAS